jgi:hypothetical protein
MGAEASASTYAESRAEKPSPEVAVSQGEKGIYMPNMGLALPGSTTSCG